MPENGQRIAYNAARGRKWRRYMPALELELMDRYVQGACRRDLLQEVADRLARLEEDYARDVADVTSHLWKRDRYGHYDPYPPARHNRFKEMEAVQRIMKGMLGGNWGPPNTIRWIEGIGYDMKTLAPFVPPNTHNNDNGGHNAKS